MTRDDIIRMVEQEWRDRYESAKSEARVWEDRYYAMVKTIINRLSLISNPMIKPMMLAEKESFEAGRMVGAREEREACAKYLDGCNTAVTDKLAAAIRARGHA